MVRTLVTCVGGQSYTGIARLQTNGAVDTSFTASGLSFGWVASIHEQDDGKHVIAGFFEEVNGVSRNNIARLEANGTLDTSFPNTANAFKGTDSEISAMAYQASTGKLLIGGSFNTVHGTTRPNLARLNADGSLDTSFQPVLNGAVNRIIVQTNGQIIVSGFFQQVNGVSRTNLARLNASGSTDASFNAQLNPSVNIASLALQPDGKLLIGGNFTSVAGFFRYHLARLHVNGTVDQSFFDGSGFYDSNYAEISTLAVQPSGLILAGGAFEYIHAEQRRNICRLNPDGSADGTFNPGTGVDGNIHALLLLANNRAILGGNFSTYNDVSRPGIARVHAPTEAVPLCDPIPLPSGRLTSQLNPTNPVVVVPSTAANWDPLLLALYPATNGTIIVTWNFTNAPTQVTKVLTIEALPVLSYDVGTEVPAPPCASTTFDHLAGDGAFWHKFSRKMYVTGPGLRTLVWRRPNNPSHTFPQQIIGQWPADNNRYQLHVANTLPVNAAGSNQFAFFSLQGKEPTTGAALSNQFFTATGPGRSLLLLSPGLNPDLTNINFQLVRTITWNDPAHFRDTNVALIGEPITDPAHNPACGSPYVFDYLTPDYPWRVAVLTNFYNRTNRTGPVIPVNRSASGTRTNDLLLVFYEFGSRLQNPLTGQLQPSFIAWPYQPVRYLSAWPTNAETIFVAGGQGSGPVMLPDNNWKIYRQPNPAAYGYNPNEEHAFRFASAPAALRLKVNPTSVMIPPGSSAQVSVSILGDPAFAPQAPITVTVSDSREGDTNLFVQVPTNAAALELAFAITNWQTPQTLTLFASTNAGSGTNTFTLRAAGGLSSQNTVEALKVAADPPTVIADAKDFEITEGATRAVKLQLSKAPPGPVTVITTNRASPSDSANLKVQSGGTLTFYPTNWNIPQTLTLRADSDPDSGHDSALFNVVAAGAFSSVTSLRVTQADTTPVNDGVYALRNDLGDFLEQPVPVTSEPYVLVAYTNTLREGRIKVFKVLAEDATHRFESSFKAGQLIQAPYPLSGLPECPNSVAVSGPYFLDRNGDYWARAAAIVNGLPAPTNIIMRYFYFPFPTAAQNGFDPPINTPPYSGGTCLPWMDYYAGSVGTPINYTNVITWPEVPELRIGETLVKPK